MAMKPLPKLSDFDFIRRHARWIPAFAGMTKKSHSVPVMPVPDLVRDEGSPMNAGSSTGIQSMVMPVCSVKSLNSSKKLINCT